MPDEKMNFYGEWRGPKDLGTATLGTAWATVGSAFKLSGARHLSAWVDVTINSSVNPRFRLQGQLTSSGSAYSMAIATASASSIAVEDEYVELNVDADQRVVLEWDLAGVYPFGLFQACVGTAGGTAATLNACSLVTAR